MGLSYHYSFRAPASVNPEVLVDFLRGVEGDAALMGFAPTVVITGPFDTPERRNFARRVARGLVVEDPRLMGVDLPKENYWSYYPQSGVCRLAPVEGALLVVTDERGMETVFGFYRFPEVIADRAGRKIMDVLLPGEWSSGCFVDSPDPRYRAIVRRFREAGYLHRELDEFVPAESR
jgi:hypothetical protein